MLILIRAPHLHGFKNPPPQFSTANCQCQYLPTQRPRPWPMQCNAILCQYANASLSLHSYHVLKPAQTDLVLFKATLPKLLKLPQLLLLANLHSFYCIDVGIWQPSTMSKISAPGDLFLSILLFKRQNDLSKTFLNWTWLELKNFSPTSGYFLLL